MIPIVFRLGSDPVQYGLVTSFNRPGSNLTGIYDFQADLGAKRLGLLHDLLPGASHIAVLVDPTDASTESTIRDFRGRRLRSSGPSSSSLRAIIARLTLPLRA